MATKHTRITTAAYAIGKEQKKRCTEAVDDYDLSEAEYAEDCLKALARNRKKTQYIYV